MISVVDYGAGNLRSVTNALALLGCTFRVTQKVVDVLDADALILPGVGAASDTLKNLKNLALIKPIKQYVAEGRPFLGICIGLQILLSTTEEGGEQKCLGIVPGRVQRLPVGVKVPHMGWNQVKQIISHPVFDGIPDEANFYFVHSYYVEPYDMSLVAGETDYGTRICSVIAGGNLVATQFHPEKSGEFGLRMYDNFIKLAMQST